MVSSSMRPSPHRKSSTLRKGGPTAGDIVPSVRAGVLPGGGRGAHLLVVFDGARPTSDAMGSLAAMFSIDPLFGIAHPRFSDAEGQRVSPSMESGGASRFDVARGVLATLPDFYVTTECLSPCFLIRRELVANLAPTIEGWIDPRGLFAEYPYGRGAWDSGP